MANIQRWALVVGNAAYELGVLRGSAHDAVGMTKALRSMGFHTQCGKDLSISKMKTASREFVESIEPGSIALFYFAGHGMQYNGVNYLLPVDNYASVDANNMGKSYLNVQKLVDAMSERKPRLIVIILDACRSHTTLKGVRVASGKPIAPTGPGLAPMRAPPGTIIAYACAANEYSYDESIYGCNGVYTYHLLRYIAMPNTDIDLILRQVAIEVQKETQNKQTPYRYSSCNELFCLRASLARAHHPERLGGLHLLQARHHHHWIEHFELFLNNLQHGFNDTSEEKRNQVYWLEYDMMRSSRFRRDNDGVRDDNKTLQSIYLYCIITW
jgi:uncharacterized caspase-like protein